MLNAKYRLHELCKVGARAVTNIFIVLVVWFAYTKALDIVKDDRTKAIN